MRIPLPPESFVRACLGSAAPPPPYDYLLRTHRRKKVADGCRQALLHQGIKNSVRVPALPHQTGDLQNAQVPGDRRPADGEPGRDLAGRHLATTQVLKDLPSSRI